MRISFFPEPQVIVVGGQGRLILRILQLRQGRRSRNKRGDAGGTLRLTSVLSDVTAF